MQIQNTLLTLEQLFTIFEAYKHKTISVVFNDLATAIDSNIEAH